MRFWYPYQCPAQLGDSELFTNLQFSAIKNRQLMKATWEAFLEAFGY